MYHNPSSFKDSNEVKECPKCLGSGIFYGRGYVENGVFKGHTGKCFSCNGTGKHTLKDAWRCKTYYDKYYRLPL